MRKSIVNQLRITYSKPWKVIRNFGSCSYESTIDDKVLLIYKTVSIDGWISYWNVLINNSLYSSKGNILDALHEAIEKYEN
jgi:hypothetical protein